MMVGGDHEELPHQDTVIMGISVDYVKRLREAVDLVIRMKLTNLIHLSRHVLLRS